MNRQEKQACVSAIAQHFASSAGTFVVGIKGLTVAQVQGLRTALRGHQSKMQVVKNTLSCIALGQAEGSINGLEPYCKDQVALVFADSDASAVARVLCDYAKEHEKLRIVAGCVERRVITRDSIEWLGTLPGREVLLAQVCGALKSPITANASLLKQMIARLACVMQQLHAQRSGSEA